MKSTFNNNLSTQTETLQLILEILKILIQKPGDRSEFYIVICQLNADALRIGEKHYSKYLLKI